MQKYVFTIKEDVCAANNRTDLVPELLAKLPYYGELVDYETAISNLKEEYQATIDNLTVQLEKLKDHNLTEDEIKLLSYVRASDKSKLAEKEAEYAEEIARLNAEVTTAKNKLEQVKQESENLKRRVMAIVGTAQ